MASKTAEPTSSAPQLDALVGPTEPTGALLQRIITPRPGDPIDVRSLYVDEAKNNRKRARALGRLAVEIPEQSEISFAAYFNAFPASYWRRWTTLDTLELRLMLDNPCRVDVYRSKADGTEIHVAGRAVERAGLVSFILDLTPFEDGGWYWFDIATGDDPVVLADSGWYAPSPAPGKSTVAIAFPTFNRPADCVATLRALSEDPLVLDAVRAIFIADQGTKKIHDEEGFVAAAEALGDRLRVNEQPNLGGSGGYARGIYEALTTTDCDQILLMDDDIVIEPDSILRALAFAQFAERPMLVGGQMLNLQARSHLHSMGEVVDPHQFMWRAAPHVTYDHDFAKLPLRDPDSKDLHRRIDVDYNGWWTCMIPRSVLLEIGLPLPLFLKWDDVEIGLRAERADYPTASVPGIAVWHMPWSDKDDAIDWQAYFHLRNRLIVAVLYGRDQVLTELIPHSLKATMKHLMSLEYSTVALQHRAVEDFLAGPRNLFKLLPDALPEVRKERAKFADGRILSSAKELPLPSMDMVHAERFLRPPTNVVARAKTLTSGLVHNLRPVDEHHHERPQLNVAARDARWFLLSRVDGATVATADGRGVAFRKRDPKTFWRLLRQALADRARLAREWPKLRREYRNAFADLTSLEAWGEFFHG